MMPNGMMMPMMPNGMMPMMPMAADGMTVNMTFQTNNYMCSPDMMQTPPKLSRCQVIDDSPQSAFVAPTPRSPMPAMPDLNDTSGKVSKLRIAPNTMLCTWVPPGKSMKSTNKHALSQKFELTLGSGRTETFILMLFPKTSYTGKGGSSFKKCKAKGYLQLKCEANLDIPAGRELDFRFYASKLKEDGDGSPYHYSDWVTHDFSSHAVYSMPKEERYMFHLPSAASNDKRHFEVGIEVVDESQ
jgi:hypothetical protein